MLNFLQFLNPDIAFPAYPSFLLRIYSQNSSITVPNVSGTVYTTDRNDHVS